MPDWDSILDDIPSSDAIRLTRSELLLLDWVICSGSSLMAPISEDLMAWQDFRLQIWKALPEPDEKSLGVMFEIGEIDAKVLLAAVPTTFSWGDGLDCGFTLKVKLAARLALTYIDPQIQEDEDARQNEAENKTESGSPTSDETSTSV